LFEPVKKSTKNRVVPYCVFTDPELGRTGITEKEAIEKKLNYKIARLPMSSVARAIESGETAGFMKAIVDADTDEILGASVLGVYGGEISSVLNLAILGKLKYTLLRDGVFAHPTFSESLNNLFATFQEKTNQV
jgi:pyruvate/2-oxoglutarate dehydrogenase complex dihydrolipoamide dehydrogenase (E3) component